jgi:phage gpG-like protein
VASVGIRGDFSKLKTLTNRLKDLAGKGPMSQLSAQLAEESLYQVRQGFRNQRDPYGEKWRPLKRRSGRILRDTGRMANSYGRVKSDRKGFVIASNVDYSGVHQYGARYTRAAGSTSRKRGRFTGAKLLTKRGRLKKGFRQVSHGAHGVEIPVRMMVPVQWRGLGQWKPPLERTARRFFSRMFKTK